METSVLAQPFIHYESPRKLNNTGNLASGDSIGVVPATQYVDINVTTSINGATRIVPAKTTGGERKAQCFDTASATVVPRDWPKIRILDGEMPTTSIAHSTTEIASSNNTIFGRRATTLSKPSIVECQESCLAVQPRAPDN